MALDGTPGRGSLVRVDAGPVAATVRTGLTIGNGLGWSPDGRTMYHVDTPQPIVQRFAYDPISGDLGAELQPIDVAVRPGGEAGPDGLCTDDTRSEEHTSELQSLMRISYAVFCLKKKKQHTT